MKPLKDKQDKIQEICTLLRAETLEPAKKEAEEVLHAAEAQARDIIAAAEREAQKRLERARLTMEQERKLFHSSQELAAGQALESLRQKVETALFNPELGEVLGESAKPDLIARLISAIVKAIDTEGISADLTAVIPKTVSVDEVNRLLLEGIQKKLREKSVVIGDFDGGAKVKLHDKKMTIDITDVALTEALTSYVRKDFRKLFFAPSCSTTS